MDEAATQFMREQQLGPLWRQGDITPPAEDTTFELIPHWTEDQLRQSSHVLDEVIKSVCLKFSAIATAGKHGNWLDVGFLLDQTRFQLGTAAQILGQHCSKLEYALESRYLLPECRQPLASSYCFQLGDLQTVMRAVGELDRVVCILLYYQQALFEKEIPECCSTTAHAVQKIMGWELSLAPAPPYETALYGSSLANVYDESRPFHEEVLSGLRGFAERWLYNRDVLELGAGTGRIGMIVVPFVRAYYSVEFSAAMLDCFRRKLTTIHAPYAKVELGDALALQLPGNSFDHVIEHEVMLFVPSPLKAVREAFRVLKSGGSFIRILIHSVGSSVWNALLYIFRQEVCAYMGYPFVIRGKGTDVQITQTLQRWGIATTEVVLAEWEEQSTLTELIATLECRAYPYLQDLPIEALRAGVTELKKQAVVFGLKAPHDTFFVRKRLYCLISTKPEAPLLDTKGE
jgi:ubiquinone/menaquinone biosynthesis C-methylase UbiE